MKLWINSCPLNICKKNYTRQLYVLKALQCIGNSENLNLKLCNQTTLHRNKKNLSLILTWCVSWRDLMRPAGTLYVKLITLSWSLSSLPKKFKIYKLITCADAGASKVEHSLHKTFSESESHSIQEAGSFCAMSFQVFLHAGHWFFDKSLFLMPSIRAKGSCSQGPFTVIFMP